MAQAAVRSKEVVLLLLVHCLLLLQLFVCFLPLFCDSVLHVHIALQSSWWMGKRELVALFYLSSWCLVTVSALWRFIAMPLVGLWCVFVEFPDHIRLLLCLKNTWVQMPKTGFLSSNDYMLVSIIHVNFRFKGPLISCFMNKQLTFTLYVKV